MTGTEHYRGMLPEWEALMAWLAERADAESADLDKATAEMESRAGDATELEWADITGRVNERLGALRALGEVRDHIRRQP
jgi:hypothetical protein